MSLQAPLSGEAILEQLAHHRLVVGQGDQTVAQVAGRRHSHVPAQQPGAAAVVGHRHHGGQVAAVRLESAEERREAASSADRHNARPSRQPACGTDLARRLRRRLPEHPHAASPVGQSKGADRHPVDRQQQGGPVPVLEPAHAEPSHELRRPQHTYGEDRRVDEEHAAGAGQKDPAFDAHTRGEPLERARQRSAHQLVSRGALAGRASLTGSASIRPLSLSA